MRKLTCVSPGQFEYSDDVIPPLKDGEALVRVVRIGICGTDLHAFEGTQPYFDYPRILGHELACEIIELNNVKGFNKGEVVTIMPYFSCGTCHACIAGKTNCCVSLRVCGVHVDGGMREYFVVPGASLIHGRGLSPDLLAVVEPLAIGAHAVRRSGIRTGEHVLVIGAGPIGASVILFLGLAGARVTILDINPWRLDFCSQFPGVSETISGNSPELVTRLKELTSGRMPSVVMDATGNLNAINNGFQYMSHGGKYVLVGLQKENITLSHPEFHKREGTLLSSRNATSDDFEFVLDSVALGKLDPLRLVTDRIPFAETAAEFKRVLNPGSRVMKAIVGI